MKIDGQYTISENKNDIIMLDRMREHFETLYGMSKAIANGQFHGMVVYGPPGVGKSHNVAAALKNEELFTEGFEDRNLSVSGYMTTVNLYMLLYKYRHENHVLVLDDIDSIFVSPESLNLLKAALDSGESRTVSYMAQSRALEKEGIPKSFDFKGGIILITNINFDTYKGKVRSHLDAIVSRCHYLDLSVKTDHQKLLWIKDITLNGNMLRKKLHIDEAITVIEFIEQHADQMRELSLRMVSKIADLKIIDPENWKRTARITCMKD